MYKKALVKIPAPDYYVLYNGKDDAPDRQELKLSDAFMTASPGYEWTAKFLNINAGRNKMLLDACPSLKGYTFLVEYMREGIEAGLSDEQAADKAIDRCISENFLKDYLLKRRGEAKMMLLHFDETDLANEREEGREEGRVELAEAIDRLKAGETMEDLIASGVNKRTAEIALKYA